MTAFFISTVTVKDPEKFQDYAQQAGKSFAPFGGEGVLRGKMKQALVGEADHQAVGIIKFPDMDSLNNWYQSAAYQKLIPLRNSAVDMTLVTYAVPS
jgi:uncharacterized protein (DUF1330 family)